MRNFLRRINHLSRAAHTILRGVLLTAGALTASSLALHLFARLPDRNTYLLRATADAAFEMAPGLLLLAVVVAAVAEAVVEEKNK